MTQAIQWTRLPDGSHWGKAAVGTAYKLERDHVVSGQQQWLLTEFPNHDSPYGEAVDVGPFADLKRRAALEANCREREKA